MGCKKKRKLSAWQKHVKSVMAKNPGLSFKRALHKAKGTYKKGTKTSRKPSRQSNPRKKVRRMARRKRRRRTSFTLPMAVIGGLIAGIARPVQRAMQGDLYGAMQNLVSNYTGYHIGVNEWYPWDMKNGIIPLVIGALVHKFIGGTLGVNRMLGRAKIPILRL